MIQSRAITLPHIYRFMRTSISSGGHFSALATPVKTS
jgi:hypothetical protein